MTRWGISNTDGNRISHSYDPQKIVGGNFEVQSQRRDIGYKTGSLEFRVFSLVSIIIYRLISEGSPSTETGRPATSVGPLIQHVHGLYRMLPGQNMYLL